MVCLLGDELSGGDTVFDPVNPLQHTVLPREARLVDLRRVVMAEGRRLRPEEDLAAMAERCRMELARLPEGCARLINPHRYKVSVSEGLNDLRNCLLRAGLQTGE